ncbi:MAG: type II toxin-antitoxin system HicA family toxin [Deltaproteobacteria bacterium]|nr:type II toxin-antitoxin system HicA family toxin [Deltaproteobacteria bacterium]MBW2118868.1 type II toxin-antitoxin system HicA family toxin [Deltaproteobacteria bacterium]MBW2344240.1 type II toxin-antitoxin system HicA family toxin [Deltaproteobacteria bacterium]
MTKLPIISSKEIVKALRAAGFENAPKRGKGSHIAMMKRDHDRTRLVVIPDRKNIPRGTLRAILDQAGLTREEFQNLLKI